MIKTNAMRQLDKAKIKYEPIEYEVNENDLSGTHVAEETGLPPEIMFKTIVAKGDKKGFSVFCIPVNCELDLKKCAVISGNKKIELLHVKDLFQITGYVRGGCSPIGMKKKFPTFMDSAVQKHEKVTISAGAKGCQLMVKSDDLISFVNAEIGSITLIKE